MARALPLLVLLSCATLTDDPALQAEIDVVAGPRAARFKTLAVGVLRGDARAFRGYGTPAPDERTVYEIGSITKAFTGILLAGSERHSPDDPLSKHFPPGFKPKSAELLEITLGQIATHRSGLPRMPTNFAPKDRGNPYADYGPERMFDFLRGLSMNRDPGEAYEYSNLGMGLLGHVLSGGDYEKLVVDRICAPLGMDDTRIALSDDQKRRLAPGHDASGKAVPNWDIPGLAGAGALRSTVRDMLRFLAANVDAADGPMARSHAPRADAQGPTRIGLGWHLTPLKGGRIMVWHNGGTGGYRTFAGFVKETRTAVVALSSSALDEVDAVAIRILEALNPK
jgi:CubicO group peptidase (beta-lactamase class C family)